jgi:hypothetical protein
MTITPLELLDTSIAQLQTLVAFLDDQLGWTESATLETRACKEIARSLCVLIQTHRLRGMKAVQVSSVAICTGMEGVTRTLSIRKEPRG